MPALALALATLKSSTLDTALYESTHAPFEKGLAQLARGESAEEAVRAWYESWTKAGAVEGTIDLGWLDQTSREARSGVERLEVELKGYTTNLIKESIRVRGSDSRARLTRWGRWVTGISRCSSTARATFRDRSGATRRAASTAPRPSTSSKCAWASSKYVLPPRCVTR